MTQVLLAFIALLLPMKQVSAKEYIWAKKNYLYANAAWEPLSDNLTRTMKGMICDQPNFVGCSVLYISETWSAADGQWVWSASVNYTRTYPEPQYPPNSPPQAVQSVQSGLITYSCPTKGGWSEADRANLPGICVREADRDPDCEVCKKNIPAWASPPIVGNPIFPSTLVKQEVETDYINSKGTLRFVRTYRSDEGKWAHNYQTAVIDTNRRLPKDEVLPEGACVINSAVFPEGIRYCHPYASVSNVNDIAVRRGAKATRYFSSSSNLSGSSDDNDRLSKLTTDGQTVGWSIRNGDTNAIEIYNVEGRLQSSQSREGLTTTFSYSDSSTPLTTAPRPGLLLKVTDHYGDALSFTYDVSAYLSTMTTPAGDVYTYIFDPIGNLTSITYPDAHLRTYLYNEADKMGTVRSPFILTGIVDENGNRYATFRYNNLFEAISTEHAGGVEKYSFNSSSTQTTVTDPLGTERKYKFASALLGKKRFTGLTQPAPVGTGDASSSIAYDANANVSSMTDLNGTKTTFAYNLTRNLETSRVEAFGTTLARTISTEWHASWNLPIRIAEPRRLTTFSYDSNSNLLTKSIQTTADATGASAFNAPLTGVPRVWTYTYNDSGQVLTIKGPRTDINEMTTYTYDEKGNLTSTANAAGHITFFSNYDLNGRVGKITDPNGLVTDFSYTPRGWLSSKTVGGEVTSYAYDGVGQLTQVTLPDNATISYTYDAAHRLTNIVDSLGNSFTFTLDVMGNRTLQTVNDPSGVLARKTTRIYDALSKLKQQTGGAQ
jgi:YD repeat-containing protein